MADSAVVELSMAMQTAKGTIPTGAYDALPINSDGLTATPNTIQSGRRSTSRLAGASFLVGVSASGELNAEFSQNIWEDLMSSALSNTWDTAGATEDELVLGKIPQYFTVVKRYPYIPIDPNYTAGQVGEYEVYQDCQASSISFTLADQQIIAFNIGIAAGALTQPLTAPYASVNPAANEASLITCSALQEIKINGVSPNSVVTNLTFELSSESREQRDIRECSAVGSVLGVANITGTVDALHDAESALWFQQALTNTAGSLEFTVAGATKTYRVVVPTLSTTAGAPDSSGDDVTSSFPYSAYSVSPSIFRTK